MLFLGAYQHDGLTGIIHLFNIYFMSYFNTKTSNMSDEEEAMVKYSQNTFGSITEQQTELKEKQNKQK